MIACGTSSRSPLNSRTASQAGLNSRYRPEAEHFLTRVSVNLQDTEDNW